MEREYTQKRPLQLKSQACINTLVVHHFKDSTPRQAMLTCVVPPKISRPVLAWTPAGQQVRARAPQSGRSRVAG